MSTLGRQFGREIPDLHQPYDQYSQKVVFLIVSIVAAHPSDVWPIQSNRKDKVVFASPKDFDRRTEVAGGGVRKLAIKIPRQ